MKRQCLILCGGQGARLQSVLNGKPKILAPINGSLFIYHLLNLLQKQNVDEVIMCTGYQSQEIINTVGNQYKNISIIYSEEKHPLGTAGCIRLALPFIINNPILVINGDTFLDINIDDMYKLYYGNNADGIIAANIIISKDVGNITINNNNQITTFMEKNDTSKKYANNGWYILNKQLIKNIEENKFISIEKDMFPIWTKQYKIYAFVHKNNFTDIGTPERLTSFAKQKI